MSFNWINTTVGEYSPFIYGKAIRKADQLSEGTPVYGSNGVYTFSEEPLSEQHAVIIGRKGSVGKVHLSTKPCWISDTAFYTTKDTIEEAYFVYYLLSSLGLEDMNTDAAVPGLNRNNAHRLEIKIPSTVEERVALVEPLINLDKKIELNRQTNQTLEQIAQAIFKSWFVDFEPTRAKIIVQNMGADTTTQELAAQAIICGAITLEQLAEVEHNLEATLQQAINEKLSQDTQTPINAEQLKATAALFPSAMVESELGEIPRKWSVSFLRDVAEITYGKTLPTKKLLDKGFPVFGGHGVIGFFNEFLYEEPMTLVSCRGAASGKVLRSLPKSFVTNNSLVINHNKKGYLTQYYLEETLKKYGLTELTSGSAQPQMTIQNMAPVQIVIPSEEIIVAHKVLVAPLFNQILQKQNENEALKDLRDALLPKLLSGELDVSALADNSEASA